MTKREQQQFARELCASILSDTLHDIRANRVPETWDGAELRQLLADRFERAVYRRPLMGRRGREYRDNVLTNDL
jgi:hypothetical protein